MATIGRLFVEIAGDSTKLSEAVNQAKTAIESTGGELKKAGERFITAFEGALNPTKQFEAQVKLLSLAGKSNSEIMAVMGDKLKAAIDVADKNKQPVDNLIRNIVKTGEETKTTTFSFESLGKTLTDFAGNPLQAAQQGIVGMLEKMGPMAVGIGGVATAAVAAGAALYKFVSGAADQAEALQNLSAQTGESTQMIQALQQITKEAGLEGMDFARTLGQINAQLGEGKGDFVDALNKLGISMTNLATGKPKEALDLLDEIRLALLAMPEGAVRAQAANDALGGRLRDLIPLLLNSKTGMRELTSEMIAQGVAFTDVQQKGLLEVDAALDRIERQKAITLASSKGFFGALTAAITDNYQISLLMYEAQKKGIEITRNAGESAADFKLRIVEATKGTEKHTEATKEATSASKFFAFSQEELAKQTTDAQKAIQKETDAQNKLNESLSKAIASSYVKMQDALNSSVTAGAVAAKAMDAAFQKANDDGIADLIQSLSWLEDELVASGKAARGAAQDISEMGTRSGLSIEELNGLLAPVPEAFETAGTESRDAFATKVSTIWSDFSQNFAKNILDGNLKGAFKELGNSLLAALTETLITPFTDAFTDALGGMLSRVTNKLGDWAGGALDKIFGGGGAASSVAGAGGSAASGIGGSVSSVASSGVMGTINMISGAVSAIADVVALFKKDKWVEVEQNTRYTYIELEEVINRLWAIEGRIDTQIHADLGNIANLTDQIAWGMEAMPRYFDRLADSIVGALDDAARYVGRAIDSIPVAVPAYASGTDYVPRTGLALVHQGEKIIPAGRGGSGVTVNINGPVYGMDDLDKKIAASIKRTRARGGMNFL